MTKIKLEVRLIKEKRIPHDKPIRIFFGDMCSVSTHTVIPSQILKNLPDEKYGLVDWFGNIFKVLSRKEVEFNPEYKIHYYI